MSCPPDSPPSAAPSRPANECSYLIISGGTGANSIAHAFGKSPAFVLPVSDDGGSSAEILRCFGGPSIGDIRSRLIRLIPLPDQPKTKDEIERQAIYDLLAYRFPADASERVVRDIWLGIVEGRSLLWAGIGEDKKECIRGFLIHFQTLALRKAHKRFSFSNFSLGNGFLAGARDFFSSLPSAIALFKSLAGVESSAQVIPVINSEETLTIAARLQNGTQLVGQCNISHPAAAVPVFGQSPATSPLALPTDLLVNTSSNGYGSITPVTDGCTSPMDMSPTSCLSPSFADSIPSAGMSEHSSNINYRKGEDDEGPLEARIDQILYVSHGHEIHPEPNPEYLAAIAEREVLVYSCGSLYTSIIPCLALKGVASAIAASATLRARILLLNATNDRETPDYKASEHISAIASALRSCDKPGCVDSLVETPPIPTAKLVTHVAYLEGCGLHLDAEAVQVSDLTAAKPWLTANGPSASEWSGFPRLCIAQVPSWGIPTQLWNGSWARC